MKKVQTPFWVGVYTFLPIPSCLSFRLFTVPMLVEPRSQSSLGSVVSIGISKRIPLIVYCELLNYYQSINIHRAMYKTLNKEKLPHKEPLTLQDDCPMCGSYLIIRQPRNHPDKFLGCASYPDCKFTTTIKND